ncbi:MAG: hypothetical protein NTY30_01060, partial [Candidatus Berkelbacteria bacterium]|nr:hypothetical protein [Candidatus Berkelbacteria bacterium]
MNAVAAKQKAEEIGVVMVDTEPCQLCGICNYQGQPCHWWYEKSPEPVAVGKRYISADRRTVYLATESGWVGECRRVEEDYSAAIWATPSGPVVISGSWYGGDPEKYGVINSLHTNEDPWQRQPVPAGFMALSNVAVAGPRCWAPVGEFVSAGALGARYDLADLIGACG